MHGVIVINKFRPPVRPRAFVTQLINYKLVSRLKNKSEMPYTIGRTFCTKLTYTFNLIDVDVRFCTLVFV